MEFTLPTGVKLIVQPAPMKAASAFRMAILRALKGGDLANIELGKAKLSKEDLASNPGLFQSLINQILEVGASESVELNFFTCAAFAVYGDQKITPGLFDDPKYMMDIRKDYFLIFWHVAEVNVWPFFEQTFSKFRASLETLPSSPQ